MSDEITRNMSNAVSFEERVLAEFAAMRSEFAAMRNELTAANVRLDSIEARLNSVDARLTTLEDKVDVRLRETRPIWEGVQQRLTEIETGIRTLNRHFKTLIQESFDLRSRVSKLEDDQPMA